MPRFTPTAAVCALLLAGTVLGHRLRAVDAASAVKVEVRKEGDKYQLYRGGQPYFIQGAGGDGSLEALKAAGGNSTRTWGVENAQARLDEAQRLGMTVTVGIWLQHEGGGFSYS